MSTRITVVIEYEEEKDIPSFGINTIAAIGVGRPGIVVAVAFEDALQRMEEQDE